MDLKTWTMIIFGLLGGLGLFLYGMTMLSEGLQKSAGEKLKKILEKLTSNRFIGVAVGTVVTMLIQSSSATTVMVVGFVNAGLLNLTQALSVVLGANIGTTITAQILAFKISILAMPAIGIGAVCVLFIKKDTVQYAGQIVLGFGMLFLGLDIMTNAFEPLQHNEGFRQLFVTLSRYPILAVAVGAFTTMVVQSSSATIGITLALVTNGLVDFYGAAALVLGENIGTTVTANLAAIGGSRTAKQAAFGHFLFNFLGVCYMLVLLKPFTMFIDFITPGDVNTMVNGIYPNAARHVANVHTMFNIINAIVFIPLLPVLAKLSQLVIKTDTKQQYEYTHLADAMLTTPETAVAQLRQEVARMSGVAMTMLKTAETAIQQQDKEKMGKVSKYEKTLDGFRTEIFNFIEKLQGRALSDRAITALERLRTAVFNLEEIGDHAKSIMKSTSKMLEKEQELSAAARKELNEMFEAVILFAGRTFNAFSSGYPQPEEELTLEDEIDKMHKQFRKNHVKRLNKDLCSLDTGMAFVDILNSLETIGDNIFAVAQINLYRHNQAPYTGRAASKARKEPTE